MVEAMERTEAFFRRKEAAQALDSGKRPKSQRRHGCFVELCHGIESSKWAIFGKQNWRCGMNRKPGYGAKLRANLETHKGCWSIKTAGRWSWKSKSAKDLEM
ncbi:hypothetical protein R6Q59_023610 [Mikania micrantha]